MTLTPEAVSAVLGALLLFELVHLGLLLLVARRLPPADYAQIIHALDGVVERLRRAPPPPRAAVLKPHACRWRFNSEERTNKLVRRISVCETAGCRNVHVDERPEGTG